MTTPRRGPPALPPHPATVARSPSKDAALQRSSAQRPPHPATVARSSPAPAGAVQRTLDENLEATQDILSPAPSTVVSAPLRMQYTISKSADKKGRFNVLLVHEDGTSRAYIDSNDKIPQLNGFQTSISLRGKGLTYAVLQLLLEKAIAKNKSSVRVDDASSEVLAEAMVKVGFLKTEEVKNGKKYGAKLICNDLGSALTECRRKVAQRNIVLVPSEDHEEEHTSNCWLTTACTRARGLPDDCEELEALRVLRDEYLLTQEGGRALVSEYYRLAPTILAAIEASPDRDRIFAEVYGVIRGCVEAIHKGEPEAAISAYTGLIVALRAQHAVV